LRTNWVAKKTLCDCGLDNSPHTKQAQNGYKQNLQVPKGYMNQILQCFFANSRRSLYLIDILLCLSILRHVFCSTQPKNRETYITRWES